MSLFGQTLVLYLIVGIGVAGAVYIADRSTSRAGWIPIAAAVPFWPLYLPLLLTPRESKSAIPIAQAADDLAGAITQVEAELDAALGSLDGWAEDVLAQEKLRIRDLRSAWQGQAQRIRDMDRVLALPEFGDEALSAADRLLGNGPARRQNVDRLRRLRKRAHDDLASSLSWVRELVSMIHLAKFNGSSTARTQELVAQIAAAVEGLSAIAESEEADCVAVA